jgi:hypothetical protein
VIALSVIAGCFYIDSCVVFSELLDENKERMEIFKKDVHRHNISCYVSETVINECREKVTKTIDFIGDLLTNLITGYLEKLGTQFQRDLTTSTISNGDLHIIRTAFLEIGGSIRRFDLLTDPFQAVEEWIVEKFEEELEKAKKPTVHNIITQLTTIILKEVNSLQSEFESLIELEASYIAQSDEPPDPLIAAILVNNSIHQPDADHISVISSHQKNKGDKAIFLTFDYKTILKSWSKIQKSNIKLNSINCCDPIYGLSFLR